MKSIVFAAISPHPPIILPEVGSAQDRKIAQKTIESLELLGKRLQEAKPDFIVISSPHEDWGFNVPLRFLAPDFKGKIKTYLIGSQSPASYFEQGKKVGEEVGTDKIALIASGDMSHVLKEDGPYGFDPQGPEFDRALIKCLEEKNIDGLFNLDEKYPKAGECGLRSFCFVLGILEGAKINWHTEVLSYEGPWGVGYLTANLKPI